jgi:hypothetical protein
MRAAGTLLLVLLAATARADDPAPPAGDSIAAARKDLATIQAPVVPPEAGTLLTIEMKDVGPVPGVLKPVGSPLLQPEKDPSEAAKKKTGTGNWLVDAMDRNTSAPSSRSKEKDDILKGDPDLIRADEKGVRLERDPAALDDARDRDRPGEAAEAVYNPLDSFMSGWISARDRDLLLLPSKGADPAGGDGARTRVDFLPGLEVVPVDSVAIFERQPPDFGAPGDWRNAANPYVAAMDVLPAAPMISFAVPDLSGFAPADLEDMTRGLSTSGVDPRPIDTSRSFTPDFAQPDDDDKYFKQLKKF